MTKKEVVFAVAIWAIGTIIAVCYISVQSFNYWNSLQ
jgi:hypothetical protein